MEKYDSHTFRRYESTPMLFPDENWDMMGLVSPYWPVFFIIKKQTQYTPKSPNSHYRGILRQAARGPSQWQGLFRGRGHEPQGRYSCSAGSERILVLDVGSDAARPSEMEFKSAGKRPNVLLLLKGCILVDHSCSAWLLFITAERASELY